MAEDVMNGWQQVPPAEPQAPAVVEDHPLASVPVSTSVEEPKPDNTVNVMDPGTGEVGSIHADQLHEALQQGYQQASPEQVDHYLKKKEFGTPVQSTIAAAENFAKMPTFGLSTLAERAIGVPAEDIRARSEVNERASMAGELAGLVGPGLLKKAFTVAGEAAVNALGLTGESIVHKIGSAAAKEAVAGAMIQGANEASKMFAEDPNQTAQTAIGNIGLASVLAGGFGGITSGAGQLWQSTSAGKLGTTLNAIKNRMGGAEGGIPSVVDDALQSAGINAAPEVRAAFSSDPQAQGMFQALQESASSSGKQAQDALGRFKNDVGNALVESVGRTPEHIEGLGNLSEYESGQGIKKSLIEELRDKVNPISEQYEKIKNKFKATPMADDAAAGMADKISNLVQEEGYNLSPSSAPAKEIQNIFKEIPNIRTLEDLRKYGSIVSDNTNKPELWKLGGQLRKIFRDTEEKILDRALGEEAPEMIGKHAAAREAYKGAMGTIDELNDRLHVGRFGGPSSFIKALDEMAPEDVLRRLSPKGDAGLIQQLTEKFPMTTDKVKGFHLDQLLKNAASKAAPGETISPKAFLAGLDKLSPEMKQFMVPAEGHAKISAIKDLLDKLPGRINSGGAAKAMDALWKGVPGSVLGMVEMLKHNNVGLGFLMKSLTDFVSRDAPDAIKLSLLKYLGSAAPVDAAGFKAMVDYTHHAIEGENMLSKAAKNVFKNAGAVLATGQVPREADRKKLDKELKKLQMDPTPLTKLGEKTSHYIPDHAGAASQTIAAAVNYLNSQRPAEKRPSPLDTPIKPTEGEKSAFNNLLDIAQQPIVVLDKIKNGTLTPVDVNAVKTMYPDLYNRMNQKLMAQVIESQSKDEMIPYTARMGISLFMGQPMDSTMTPSAILAAQPKPQQDQQQPQGGPPKKNMNGLSKMSKSYQTSSQALESRKETKNS